MSSFGTFNIDTPPPEHIHNEVEARELLRLLLRKNELEPDDPIAFDTETYGKRIENMPSKSGRKPLDWMQDNITFWSLAARFDDSRFRRWCLRREDLHTFSPLLENQRVRLATWNGKYDAHVTWNSGVDIWCSQVLDLMTAGYLYDENLQGDMDLKSRSADWLGLNMTKYKDLFGDMDARGQKIVEFKTSLFDLPLDLVSNYASYDAYATLRLFYYLKERLLQETIDYADRQSNMWEYFLEMEVPFTRVLWRMERRGILIDKERLQRIIPPIDTELAKIERNINRVAGSLVNLDAPVQLAWLFFGEKDVKGPLYANKTGSIAGMGLPPIKLSPKTQAPSTDEEVLEDLAASGVDIARQILRVRKIRIVRRTFAGGLLALSSHHQDGRVHPSFNQYGARTGRLSATAPNSTNQPRPDNDEFGIREAFIAPPGKKLIVADYEQLEMRIMADRSGDPRMIRAIREGKDLHCYAVSLMWRDTSYEEAYAAKKAKGELTARQKDLLLRRQRAKTVGFAIIYGAGKVKIGLQLDISADEAQALIDSYFAAFPGVKAYMQNTVDICRHGYLPNGKQWPTFEPNPEGRELDRQLRLRHPGFPAHYVRTLTGRRRRLKDIIHSNWTLRGHAEREAVNTTEQGSAADIVKQAMIGIDGDRDLNLLGYFMINQVHDEIIGEAYDDAVEQCIPIIREYMEHPFERGKDPLRVPLPANIVAVQSWNQAK